MVQNEEMLISGVVSVKVGWELGGGRKNEEMRES